MNGYDQVDPALGGLKYLRELRNISQRRMADSMGVEAKKISLYETEDILPRLSCLRKMCRVLECELWQLFFDPERHGKAA